MPWVGFGRGWPHEDGVEGLIHEEWAIWCLDEVEVVCGSRV